MSRGGSVAVAVGVSVAVGGGAVPVAAILWVLKPACCAWPFIVLLTSMGLGAVFHTRFGKQSCNQGKANVAPGEKPGESEVLPAEAMDEETGAPDLAP